MSNTDQDGSTESEHSSASSSGLCRLPVSSETPTLMNSMFLQEEQTGLLLYVWQEWSSYSHLPKEGGQHCSDYRVGTVDSRADSLPCPAPGVGVENVAPRLTKLLALQR